MLIKKISNCFFKTYYNNPKIFAMMVGINIGLDYYNNKILGKLHIIEIPENIIKLSYDEVNENNLIIKNYIPETMITTFLLTFILGPLSLVSYTYDIYENYKIRKYFIE